MAPTAVARGALPSSVVVVGFKARSLSEAVVGSEVVVAEVSVSLSEVGEAGAC